MDHYQTLGVPRDAPPEAIRAAFRNLSRRHHPDTSGHAAPESKRFQAIKAAYDVLRDPAARAGYDESLADSTQVHTPHFTWSNIAATKGRRGSTANGRKAGQAAPDRPDLDRMIDAYFGRWNDPE
jgi:curved DNA-binding protein